MFLEDKDAQEQFILSQLTTDLVMTSFISLELLTRLRVNLSFIKKSLQTIRT